MWHFAMAPLGLKIGDLVTFKLTEGGQAVDLQAAASWQLQVANLQTEASKPRAEGEPGPAAKTGARIDLQLRADEPEIPRQRGLEPSAAQRKLQRNMSRFHNANVEQQLEMLLKAEQRLNALLAGDEVDGAALCSLVNKLAGFLHAPGNTIQVATSSGTGDASLMAGSRNAGLQRKVRKLLIGCLELLDLSDSTTYALVETAVQHIAQLVIYQKLSQNQLCDEDPASSINRKCSTAVTQWQMLAALVGASQDDAVLLAPADVVHGKAGRGVLMMNKDKGSVKSGSYQPNIRVRKLPSVREDNLDAVTMKCSECHQIMTSNWFWHHPKKETIYVLVPNSGHKFCSTKMGRKVPWLPVDGRPSVGDDFSKLDFCAHNHQRSRCVACGGSMVCKHKKRYDNCKFCKGRRQAARANCALRIGRK
eukprot:Skav214162  [mRNA]  locus=scaffold945:148030:149289:- [translate_table: standard]